MVDVNDPGPGQAKNHYDHELQVLVERAGAVAAVHTDRPAATWAALAATLTDEIAGKGGLDYAVGLLASALCRAVDREGRRS